MYLFYGENDIPLYIGKSTRLRSRVLSHFSADHESDRELSLSQQVRRIDHVRTAGEFGALLEEARLIKRLQPILNRQLRRNRELCVWRFEQDLAGATGKCSCSRCQNCHRARASPRARWRLGTSSRWRAIR